VVNITHEWNICSKTTLDRITQEQTIICKPFHWIRERRLWQQECGGSYLQITWGALGQKKKKKKRKEK